MHEGEPEWITYQRRRWTRPKADLYLPPDARNYVRSDPNLYRPPHQRERKASAGAEYEPVWNPDARRWPERRDVDNATETEAELAERSHQLASLRSEYLRRKALHPHNYNPDQPRVPAGSREGGQWTHVAGPTQITIHPSALTGISTIDETTKKLTSILVGVMEAMDKVIPPSTPQLYGMAVHKAFELAVRSQNLKGIGRQGVETTFSLDRNDAPYGFRGSVRTDVVLRNDAGDVIAIYDVKTGERGIDSTRAAELGAKTRAAADVPVIELHVFRGVTRKYRKHWASAVVCSVMNDS
jgi:hypothetical protein